MEGTIPHCPACSLCSFPCVSTSWDYNSSLTCAKLKATGSSSYLICGLLLLCIISFTTPPFANEVSPFLLAGTELNTKSCKCTHTTGRILFWLVMKWLGYELAAAWEGSHEALMTHNPEFNLYKAAWLMIFKKHLTSTICVDHNQSVSKTRKKKSYDRRRFYMNKKIKLSKKYAFSDCLNCKELRNVGFTSQWGSVGSGTVGEVEVTFCFSFLMRQLLFEVTQLSECDLTQISELLWN